MTNTEQVKAMQAAFPGNLEADEAERSLTACRDALAAGLSLAQAVTAATCVVYPGYATYRPETRQVMLVEVVNALMVADKVERLRPVNGWRPDWAKVR